MLYFNQNEGEKNKNISPPKTAFEHLNHKKENVL